MRKCLKKKNKYRSFLEKCITGKSMKALISLLILSLCMQGNIALAGENVGLIQENDLTAQEEKAADTVDEIQEPTDLYAQSAVLMDAESGRVLFAKEGNKERAMASTTKIMTCIPVSYTHLGINVIVNLIPAILQLVGIIPLIWYKLDSKKMDEVAIALKERNEGMK